MNPIMRTDNHGNKIEIIDKNTHYDVPGKLLSLLEETAYSMRVYTLSEEGQADLCKLIYETIKNAKFIREEEEQKVIDMKIDIDIKNAIIESLKKELTRVMRELISHESHRS